MNPAPFQRVLLWPFSAAYGLFARFRAALYAKGWIKRRKLRGAVISVGNLTVGGTGKTPMILWLAEKLLKKGKRVAILSRGYKGSGGTSDEVALLRSRLDGRVVFGIGRDRFAEGKRLEEQGVDVFLLDDGFQHLSLARDVDIVLVDATRPLGMEAVLPAGRLREPLSALNRADIVVMTRQNSSGRPAARGSRSCPVFNAGTRLLGFRPFPSQTDPQNLTEIGAGPFFAFCGIGNPEAFFSDLQRWRLRVAGNRQFRDHHRYSQRDVRSLEEAAGKAGASAFVTTEKDVWNLGDLRFSTIPVYVCVIEMAPDLESEFLGAIDRKLAAGSKGSA
ncbi:MAG TPA: tetraacyldisaccharide 4'-kinase [Candidatus Acidoferrales bacterium]|nr:tetraacyldisaccharide 4'-kinase [Candidatus Acidoferrales bacterium]